MPYLQAYILKYTIQTSIRPCYNENEDLGEQIFYLDHDKFWREDFTAENDKKQTIKASMFMPMNRYNNKYDCIIFCHGNSGNRTSILECLDHILLNGLIAVSFDFTGCGKSDGKYISLGYYEQNDLDTIVQKVKQYEFINKIGVWGRSMGAVTTLLYTSSIKSKADVICCDSGFSNLKTLIYEFIQKYKIIGNLFGDQLYSTVKDYISENVNFSICDMDIVKAASKISVPGIFVHGVLDTIVDISHTERLVEVYKGRKQYYTVKGEHNDIRPRQLYKNIIQFFIENFKQEEQASIYQDEMTSKVQSDNNSQNDLQQSIQILVQNQEMTKNTSASSQKLININSNNSLQNLSNEDNMSSEIINSEKYVQDEQNYQHQQQIQSPSKPRKSRGETIQQGTLIEIDPEEEKLYQYTQRKINEEIQLEEIGSKGDYLTGCDEESKVNFTQYMINNVQNQKNNNNKNQQFSFLHNQSQIHKVSPVGQMKRASRNRKTIVLVNPKQDNSSEFTRKEGRKNKVILNRSQSTRIGDSQLETQNASNEQQISEKFNNKQGARYESSLEIQTDDYTIKKFIKDLEKSNGYLLKSKKIHRDFEMKEIEKEEEEIEDNFEIDENLIGENRITQDETKFKQIQGIQQAKTMLSKKNQFNSMNYSM